MNFYHFRSLSLKNYFLTVSLIAAVVFSSLRAETKSDDSILVTVAQKEITAHDFKKFLMDNLQSCGRIQRLSAESMKVYLDSLINFTLIINEAEKNNLDESPEFVKKIHLFKNRVLVDKLIETQVIDSILTIKKLKAFYKKYGGELNLKQLVIRFNSDSSAAKLQIQNIYKKIKDSLEFSTAAKKFSQDAMTTEKGGDIGFVKWGQLPENIQNVAFDLKPGEISKPIKTPFGYYLIKLVSKVKCGFDDELRNLKYQMAAHYAKLIKNRKNEYLVSLEIKYGLKLVYSNIKKITENVGSPYAPFESFLKNLYEIPLARYADKSINLYDLINSVGHDDLTNYRWDERNISKWISSIGMNKISVLEAESLKLDVNLDVKRYKEHQIVDLVKNNLLDQNVSDEEIHNYYNKNKSDFVFPNRVRVQYVVVSAKFVAENILEMAKKGKSFDQLVKDYTLDATSLKTNGDIGFISRSQYREIYDACKNLKIGEITGPVLTPQGFAVVKLIDREESRLKTFEEAKKGISYILLESKRNFAYASLIKNLNKEFNVKINKEMVAEFLENPLGTNISDNLHSIDKKYAKTSN